MKAARWIAMAWSTATVLVLAYYSWRWLSEPVNPLRHEFLFGISLALVVGGFAWFASPVLAWRTSTASAPERWALVAPSAVAALCLAVLASKGAL